jgi:cellulose synthase/poly-beta-1,6-N-acetylglucosamine synthase-like glycosyltransferase
MIYYLWWLVRGCDYILSTTSALFELKKHERINFNSVLYNPQGYQEKALAQKMLMDKKPQDVIHWCMIPMYNEDATILFETVEAIALSNYDLSKIAITIHGEAAKKELYEAALAKCLPLADKFGYFSSTLHVLQP